MERSRGYKYRLSEMLSSTSEFLPDANTICRRTYDNILSMSKVWLSMERKLTFSFLLICILLCSCVHAQQHDDFKIVVFICVWKRPLLSKFIIDHFVYISKQVRQDGIIVDLFIVGSDSNFTHSLISRIPSNVTYSSYAIHPNHPVGHKHNQGLLSLRHHYTSTLPSNLPDAVTIFGSDDIVTPSFFIHTRNALLSNNSDTVARSHVFGLYDVWFLDLRSKRLVYTAGYKSFSTPLSGTVGCGRVFSWKLLDAIEWHVWDDDIDRGLDQSAVRNIMQRFAFVSEVSIGLLGRPVGVMAVDIKTDGFVNGVGENVWTFESILQGAIGTGRLKKYSEENLEKILDSGFGEGFTRRLDHLRNDMVLAESE